METTYTLYIDAYSPETIPMARLAQYMQHLATLLGHDERVHFEAVKPGSTQLVSVVEHESAPKVWHRLEQVSSGDAPEAAGKAQAEIDRLLADDNASGFIYAGNSPDNKIIAFPGATRPAPIVLGPFKQDGELDGVLISVGGADKTVHIQLQNGDIKYTKLETSRDIARRLARHLYETVRVHGTGRWQREGNGQWTLKHFKVVEFSVLKEGSLAEAINKLRSGPASEWDEMDDPIGVAAAYRARAVGGR